MKSLSEYIVEKKLNKEELKDLGVCVKVSLERFMFSSKDSKMIDTLVKIADGQINDTHKEFVKKFQDDYDFDLSDPDVERDFRSALTYYAQELIDEYKLSDKYKK